MILLHRRMSNSYLQKQGNINLKKASSTANTSFSSIISKISDLWLIFRRGKSNRVPQIMNNHTHQNYCKSNSRIVVWDKTRNWSDPRLKNQQQQQILYMENECVGNMKCDRFFILINQSQMTKYVVYAY